MGEKAIDEQRSKGVEMKEVKTLRNKKFVQLVVAIEYELEYQKLNGNHVAAEALQYLLKRAEEIQDEKGE